VSGSGWDITTAPSASSPNQILTFNTNANGGSYRLCLTADRAAVRNIVVSDGISVSLTLDAVTLSTGTNGVPVLALGSNTAVDLVLAGDSLLVQVAQSGSGNNAAIFVPPSAALTVSGDGSLSAVSVSNGAGIGGGYRNPSNALTANDGSGTITIAGQANVYAGGGDSCAGIGSCNAVLGQTGDITITGQATVTAEGGRNAAGIGGGLDSYGGQITITGPVSIEATGGAGGAGIGGGEGRGGTVDIQCDPAGSPNSADPATCPNIKARSGSLAAAIGGAYKVDQAEDGLFVDVAVTIGGGIIEASAGQAGTGIGTGAHHQTGSTIITINGGQIVASGGYNNTTDAVGGPGVGGGFAKPNLGQVIINGGTLVATGGADSSGNTCGAGIGSTGSLVAGSTYDARPPTVAIGPGATVTAYAQCLNRPAIEADGANLAAQPQHVVNAQFRETGFTNDAGIDLDVFARGTGSAWKTLQLPAGYRGFAYTTGLTDSRNDAIAAYSSSNRALLGRVATQTGSTEIASDITNTAQSVSLATGTALKEQVSLSAMMSGSWTAAAEGVFTYAVSVVGTNGQPLTNREIPYTGGVVAGSGAQAPSSGSLYLNQSGKASVTLQHGQMITLEVDYTSKVQVKQTSLTAFTTSYTINESNPEAGLDTGLVMVSGPQRIVFSNVRQTAVLSISNRVTGLLADPTADFFFQVCVATAGNWTQFAYSVDGQAPTQLILDSTTYCSTSSIALHHSQVATLALPAEAEARVILENGPANYIPSYVIDSGVTTGTGADTGLQPMKGIDKLIAFINEYESVELTISKVVEGKYADQTPSYVFGLCLFAPGDVEFADGTKIPYTGGNASGVVGATPPLNGDFEVDGYGCGTLRLKHGQAVTMRVPKGTKLFLAENEIAGYAASYKVNGVSQPKDGQGGVSQVADQALVMACTNTLIAPPVVPSGLNEPTGGQAVYGIALGLALVLAAGVRRGLKRAQRGKAVS
jgi:hypothetical protein